MGRWENGGKRKLRLVCNINERKCYSNKIIKRFSLGENSKHLVPLFHAWKYVWQLLQSAASVKSVTDQNLSVLRPGLEKEDTLVVYSHCKQRGLKNTN